MHIVCTCMHDCVTQLALAVQGSPLLLQRLKSQREHVALSFVHSHCGYDHITCSTAASTAASVALVNGTTSLPVKRRRICTAVVLGPGLLAEALGATAGAELGLLGGVLSAAAGAGKGLLADTLGAAAGAGVGLLAEALGPAVGAGVGLLAEALGAAAGPAALDRAAGMGPGAAAMAAAVGLPP